MHTLESNSFRPSRNEKPNLAKTRERFFAKSYIEELMKN